MKLEMYVNTSCPHHMMQISANFYQFSHLLQVVEEKKSENGKYQLHSCVVQKKNVTMTVWWWWRNVLI